ncbi:MAG: triose-phosphate isomerase [Alphaproteobacteria bacterium]
MSHNTLIVSNWKMNFNFIQAKDLVTKLKKIKNNKVKLTNVICPQFLLLPTLNEVLFESDIIIGAQDLHFDVNGAYTGDTSIELIKDYNCKYSIIGHSERRTLHNESNIIIKKKVKLCLDNSVIPILCVGESVEQRKKNTYKDFILKQLTECIQKIKCSELVIAYEPIWSIGTGIIPKVEDIIEISELIFSFLKKEKIEKFQILYGGSVNSSNFKEINSIEKINGALIGGASLKIDEMEKILTSC